MKLTSAESTVPLAIISEVILRYHNIVTEYCLMSEDQNPVSKKQQQLLVIWTYGGLILVHVLCVFYYFAL